MSSACGKMVIFCFVDPPELAGDQLFGGYFPWEAMSGKLFSIHHDV